jgi:tRNA(fMet)-specific endonuclease VapC
VNGKLLDTNIVIAMFAQDAQVQQHLANATGIAIPSIVLGELYYGAQKSSRRAANVARVDQLAISAAVLACDAETARHYGSIKRTLLAKGRPTPENDIWIAAIVQQHQLTVVSRDEHFREVDGLSLEIW